MLARFALVFAMLVVAPLTDARAPAPSPVLQAATLAAG